VPTAGSRRSVQGQSHWSGGHGAKPREAQRISAFICLMERKLFVCAIYRELSEPPRISAKSLYPKKLESVRYNSAASGMGLSLFKF